MGFLSYCLSFYRDELGKLENRIPTEAGLYRARQLLRMLDDLADEGYTALNDRLEAAHCGVTELRKYLARNRVKPFSPVGNRVDAARLHYSIQESELRSAIAQAMNAAAAMPNAPRAPFTENLHQFCRWIGYEHKTAYIFLLRDTLLPFVYCLEQGRQRLYPWLLSRKSFERLPARQPRTTPSGPAYTPRWNLAARIIHRSSAPFYPPCEGQSALIRRQGSASVPCWQILTQRGFWSSNPAVRAPFHCS